MICTIAEGITNEDDRNDHTYPASDGKMQIPMLSSKEQDQQEGPMKDLDSPSMNKRKQCS